MAAPSLRPLKPVVLSSQNLDPQSLFVFEYDQTMLTWAPLPQAVVKVILLHTSLLRL